MDHPRDLLHLINLKRAEMPRPIIGIGHSMGGSDLYVPYLELYEEADTGTLTGLKNKSLTDAPSPHYHPHLA